MVIVLARFRGGVGRRAELPATSSSGSLSSLLIKIGSSELAAPFAAAELAVPFAAVASVIPRLAMLMTNHSGTTHRYTL